MYARLVECRLKPDKIREFNTVLGNQVFSSAGEQPGFVDLIGMVSDDHPGLALAITLWKDRESAERFYSQQNPMMEFLSPIMEEPPSMAHYTVTRHGFRGRQAA